MQSQKGSNADRSNDSVAQLVEQMTLNHWVVGSSPTGVTKLKDSYFGYPFLCLYDFGVVILFCAFRRFRVSYPFLCLYGFGLAILFVLVEQMTLIVYF